MASIFPINWGLLPHMGGFFNRLRYGSHRHAYLSAKLVGRVICSWHGNIWLNHCAILVPVSPSPSITSSVAAHSQITHALSPQRRQRRTEAMLCPLPSRSHTATVLHGLRCALPDFVPSTPGLLMNCRARAHINKIEQNYV